MGSYTIGNNIYQAKTLEPGLYIVATPIGNLGDMTLRGLEVLAGAGLVACEDTRVTGKLLARFAIRTKLHAYHEHNAAREGAVLLERLKQGGTVALVSDAGTPLVSDPGQRLVAAARQEGLPVFPVPGASAPIAALVASGFETQRFTFFGFLPNRQSARLAALRQLLDEKGTLVFFEGPSRLAACLGDMAQILGEGRKAAICRELTKLHEQTRRGTLKELAEHYAANPPRGEIVIVLAPGDAASGPVDADTVLRELLETMSVSRAAGEAAKLTGRPKRDLYQRALALKETLEGKSPK